MNILTCTDAFFVIPTGVMLYSVCKNNVGEDLNFYLLVDETVTEKQKQSLEAEVTKFEKTKIQFYKIDVEKIKKYLIVVASNFPISIYYRLLLADILPNDLNKILYLDSDIIVRHSLKDLWETDISNYSLGAVVNQTHGQYFWKRLKYPREKGYFNSGVLLINVKYWRENAFSSKFIDYLKYNREVLVYPDQDALNFVLQDSKLFLPERYNVQEFFYLVKRKRVVRENIDEIEASLHNPYILHYTGYKPWNQDCAHPLKYVYYQYKKETQWADCLTMEQISSSRNKRSWVRVLKNKVKKYVGYSRYKQIKI